MGMCLIVVPFLLLLDIFWRARSAQRSFGDAFLTASVIIGALLASMSEILSHLHHITVFAVSASWSLILVGADSWEYPFWVLPDPLKNHIRMEHIDVDYNVSNAPCGDDVPPPVHSP